MKKGDKLSLTIKDVLLHREKWMSVGAQYGNYTSNYIARFKEYPNSIAVVDDIAKTNHPEWTMKTENRAKVLSEELAGKQVSVCVTDVFPGVDRFEGVIVE